MAEERRGWIVANNNEDKWRAWGDAGPASRELAEAEMRTIIAEDANAMVAIAHIDELLAAKVQVQSVAKGPRVKAA